MKQNIFLKLPAFLFVSALNVIPVFSADDSCLLDVQNINFTFKGLRSGPNGNIYMWEPSFVDPCNRKGHEEEGLKKDITLRPCLDKPGNLSTRFGNIEEEKIVYIMC